MKKWKVRSTEGFAQLRAGIGTKPIFAKIHTLSHRLRLQINFVLLLSLPESFKTLFFFYEAIVLPWKGKFDYYSMWSKFIRGDLAATWNFIFGHQISLIFYKLLSK